MKMIQTHPAPNLKSVRDPCFLLLGIVFQYCVLIYSIFINMFKILYLFPVYSMVIQYFYK